jgi:hypothetical protein
VQTARSARTIDVIEGENLHKLTRVAPAVFVVLRAAAVGRGVRLGLRLWWLPRSGPRRVTAAWRG